MIIKSLLDQDFYKITMSQMIHHRFPEAITTWKFKCRNPMMNLGKFADKVNEEITDFCSLKFMDDEINFLKGIRFLKQDYLEFLRDLQLKKDYVLVSTKGNELDIQLEGPWSRVTFMEVPILAIVNELFSQDASKGKNETGITNLNNKIHLIEQANKNEPHLQFKFSDFGTRRRWSREWQRNVVGTILSRIPQNFTGTSNVALAKEFGITPIGTMAHEMFQASQAYVRLVDSIKFTLENWVQEYRGDLGIALTDNITMDAFLRDFDLYFAKLFDGCRHDSGDPSVWCDKLIAHYQKLKIDSRTKTAVFSDGLDFWKALELARKYHGKIKTAFGIGTNLTNDCGTPALQIVMKMVQCNGVPVAKISDNESKIMCEDQDYVNYLKKVFKIPA